MVGTTISHNKVLELDRPRHSRLVRITHWINMLSFFGLLADVEYERRPHRFLSPGG